MVIRSERNFYSGLLFAGFGSAFVITARNYPFGTTVQIGAGYFPTVLGSLLVIAGVFLMIMGLLEDGKKIDQIGLRPLVLILASIALFGFILESFGLVLAVAALVFIGAAAGHEFRFGETLVLTAALIVGSIALFIWGLSLPFSLWPQL